MQPPIPSTVISTPTTTATTTPSSLSISTPPLQLPPDPIPPQRQQYRDYLDSAVKWIHGPTPPVDVAFTPLFPALQSWPAQTFARVCKRRRHKVLALLSYFFVWLVLFIVVVHYSRFADTVEDIVPMHLSCSSSLWGKNNQCGLDGEACLPFGNSSFAFRCPADCILAGKVLNPRAVGAELVSYRPFVVGGPSSDDGESYGTYRADSFICPSAIHAGLTSARYGGCGIVTRTGTANVFPASKRHGISSIGFDATFPSSYTFSRGVETSACRDLRWHLFAVSIPFTTVLSAVAHSAAAALPFYAAFTNIFFHVALASDPPYLSNPYELVSRALSRFLPAAFIAHMLWSRILRRPHTRAPALERTVLYLGGLWLGALTNITLDPLIPLARLTSRDIAQQPGAKAALSVIVILLTAISAGQIHYLRLSGQLPRMLFLYAALGTALGLLAAIPGTSLRIHHYILALLLLPGCRLLTRPSLVYQGLLVGLFINGVARWGFAGIVETPESLVGDGLYFSSVPRFLPEPLVRAENVTVFWRGLGEGEEESRVGAVGVSVLVNDVERERWRGGDRSGDGEYTYERVPGERSYVRLAWVVRGGGTLDYTRAGVVEGSGEWREPETGWS